MATEHAIVGHVHVRNTVKMSPTRTDWRDLDLTLITPAIGAIYTPASAAANRSNCLTIAMHSSSPFAQIAAGA
jgi:hypothetical protein